MGDGAQTNCHLSFTIWLHLAVCRTIDANATSMWYSKWVPQLSAVYLRNYWFWTGGFRVHKGGRVGIQLFCWHSRQIVQNLTLKKKLWLHETLAPILNWCDPPLCNKLLRCLQPSTFSSSQTSAPGDNRWHASCIHTTPFQTAHLQHPSSWRFSHPPLWLWDSALLGTQWGTPAGCLVPQQLYSSVVQQQGYQTVRHAKVNHAKQRSKIFCFQLSSWSYFLFKRTS